MSARKPRGQGKADRESHVSQYMSEYQSNLFLPDGDVGVWLTQGNGYQQRLKLMAQDAILKLERAKESSRLQRDRD
jgi:hypothetical protein